MTYQPQQQRNTSLSLMDIMLDKLCVCSSSQEQVFDEKYGMVGQYCASTPLTSSKAGERRSIYRTDGVISYFIEHDEDEDEDEDEEDDNSIREPSVRDLCKSPSFSSQHHPKPTLFAKYPDGPTPVSPTNTQSTVSLSDSMSINSTQDDEDEWLELSSDTTVLLPAQVVVASQCFRSPKRQPAKKNKSCPSMPVLVEEVHEAYGFLLRMEPQNYLQEEHDLEEGDLDDSQYYYSTAGGVTFQLPMCGDESYSSKYSSVLFMPGQPEGKLPDNSQYYYSNAGGVTTIQPLLKLPNGIMVNGVASVLIQLTQHTVQARTA